MAVFFYDLAQLQTRLNPEDKRTKKVIGYARVSFHDQKEDLVRQAARLRAFGAEQGLEYMEIIEDFGGQLLFDLCKLNGIRVTEVEDTANATYEQQLTAEVIELMTVFSARLYGRRIHQNRKKSIA